ncbi:MAG: hypothetical protein ABIP61_06475 [Burkholderiaceae bacterium]
MSSPSLESVKTRVETVIALAHLLERVERSAAPVGADQYRSLVRQLTRALEQKMPDDALQAVLGAYPATAELYENMHYEYSGLSRSSLERSVGSEMLASELLARIAKGAAPKA